MINVIDLAGAVRDFNFFLHSEHYIFLLSAAVTYVLVPEPENHVVWYRQLSSIPKNLMEKIVK